MLTRTFARLLIRDTAAYMPNRYRIVLAEADHLSALPAIERAATVLLKDHAPASALSGSTPVSDLEAAQREQRLWVALHENAPIGFALVSMLAPSAPHLQEMDVSPAHMRQGVGTALLEAVMAWAREAGIPLTLTTFRDAPFNAPFYARRGFDIVDERFWTPAIRAIVDEEDARGLDRTRRVVMRYRG